MVFNFKFHHIPGVENRIADCFSRLTRRKRATEHFSLSEPTLGNYYKVKRISNSSPMECDNPWLQDLAAMASNMNMVSNKELGTEINNVPQECELSQLTSNYNRLSTLTLTSYSETTLISYYPRQPGRKSSRYRMRHTSGLI